MLRPVLRVAPRPVSLLVAAITLGLTGCPREPASMGKARPVESPVLVDPEAASRSVTTDDVVDRKQQDAERQVLENAAAPSLSIPPPGSLVDTDKKPAP